MVALAPGDEGRFGDTPDGNEVVLAAGEDVLTVWRPADAHETAIVRVKQVNQPSELRLAIWVHEMRYLNGGSTDSSFR